MRLSFFTVGTVGIFACLLVVVAAWSKEDQEIFRLRDEVEQSEGQGITFYDFLGIKPAATQDEINAAYRKKSRQLHPDKVKQQFIADKSTGKDKKSKGKKKQPGVHVSKGPSQSEIKAATKVAGERFARLGIVTNILRGAGRERYDHFLQNGFPKWKGTGYYYSRFRPGLGSVLVGLFVFVGGAGHWLALYMSWKRQQEFVGRYIKFARQAAWGDNMGIPGVENLGGGTTTPAVATGSEEVDASAQPMNRRQRRMQEKESRKEKIDKKSRKGLKGSPAGTPPVGTPPVGATGQRKRVVAENGKVLVVDSVGNVYLEQTDEEGETQEFLLDPNELPQPTIKDTALYRLPLWVYTTITTRLLKKSDSAEDEDEDLDAELDADPDTEEQEPDNAGTHTPATSSFGSDDFEVLEKVKTTAENGTGKSSSKKKKGGKK